MEEYGGYLEFERYHGMEYHENCIALNSGANCLKYLIKARKIRELAVPSYICSVVTDVCKIEETSITAYDIGFDFKPMLKGIPRDAWIYLVNYFGQLTKEDLKELHEQYGNLIIDNAQAFFVKALPGVDTIYTCRKFFGVCDGAYLYTDCRLDPPLEQESAYERMGFILGRFERSANQFYEEYRNNEQYIAEQKIKQMSALTHNILKSLDYETIKEVRNRNFMLLEEAFGERNQLKLRLPEGAYMYPLLVEGGRDIRDRLNRKKIYTPLLWPNVVKERQPGEFACFLADNLLPLPCDQRYSVEDMERIIEGVSGVISLQK